MSKIAHHNHNMSTPTPTPTDTEQNWFLKNWVTLVILAIVLLGGLYGYNRYFGSEVAEAPAPRLQKEFVTTTPPPSMEDSLKPMRELMEKQNQKIAELEKAKIDRDLEIEVQRDDMAKQREIVAKAELEAKAKVEEAQKASAAVAEQTKIKLKGVPTEFQVENTELKARWLGFDSEQKKGYKFPLMRNSKGQPTPFSPQYDTPVETDPKGTWVVADYTLPNGTRVPAWAVKL